MHILCNYALTKINKLLFILPETAKSIFPYPLNHKYHHKNHKNTVPSYKFSL